MCELFIVFHPRGDVRKSLCSADNMENCSCILIIHSVEQEKSISVDGVGSCERYFLDVHFSFGVNGMQVSYATQWEFSTCFLLCNYFTKKVCKKIRHDPSEVLLKNSLLQFLEKKEQPLVSDEVHNIDCTFQEQQSGGVRMLQCRPFEERDAALWATLRAASHRGMLPQTSRSILSCYSDAPPSTKLIAQTECRYVYSPTHSHNVWATAIQCNLCKLFFFFLHLRGKRCCNSMHRNTFRLALLQCFYHGMF